MKERPIFFSSAMVRAILAGTKTQTRRIVNPQPPSDEFKLLTLSDTTASKERKHIGAHHWARLDGFNIVEDQGIYFRCPYGVAGDRLWVRETWKCVELEDGADGVICAADNSFTLIENTPEAADSWADANDNGKHVDHWRPSIFMPRWASRITLEVTGVRIQRLQEISESDARAEGVTSWVHLGSNDDYDDDSASAREEFQRLWDSINSKRASWKSNPLVWVVKFRKL